MSPEQIRTLRASLKMSQPGLARFLHVSLNTVFRWENAQGPAPSGLPRILLEALDGAVQRVGPDAVKTILTKNLAAPTSKTIYEVLAVTH